MQKQQYRQVSESNGNPGKRFLYGRDQCSSDMTGQNAGQLSPSRKPQPQDSWTTRINADTGEGAAGKGALAVCASCEAQEKAHGAQTRARSAQASLEAQGVTSVEAKQESIWSSEK